jgi:hypothetical protein
MSECPVGSEMCKSASTGEVTAGTTAPA